MRRLRVALCVVFVVAFADCGDDPPKASGPAALKYVPADAHAVVVLPTDLQGEQLRRLDTLLGPTLGDDGVRAEFKAFFRDSGAGVSFARDVEPLLGKDLVAAAWGDTENLRLLVALETSDGERAGELGRKLDLKYRVDGDTLLLSLNGGAETFEPPADGFDPAAFGEDDGAALLRIAGDPRVLTEALDVDVDLPWIQALAGLSGSIRLEDHAVVARAHVTTRPDDLSDEDLPLAPGDDAPQAGDEHGAISSGNRDQSQTTVFLAQLARKAFPDSDFVAQVELAEKDLGSSFEEEVLKQFNGPSASIAWPDGTSPPSARSTIRTGCASCSRAWRPTCRASCAACRASAARASWRCCSSRPTRRSCRARSRCCGRTTSASGASRARTCTSSPASTSTATGSRSRRSCSGCSTTTASWSRAGSTRSAT